MIDKLWDRENSRAKHRLLARMLDTFFAYGFEKIWRLDNYVDEIKKVSGYPKEVSIIDRIHDGISDVQTDLLELAAHYIRNYEYPSMDISKGILQSFSASYEGFVSSIAKPDLLDLLKYTYTPWPSAQLYDLFKELKAPDTQSIVLVDTYDYWFERDKHPPFFALPKTEKDNPLMWPILGHELGHNIWYKENVGNVLNNDERFNKLLDRWQDHEVARNLTNDRDISRKILMHWHEEYFADLYAINFIGPCYLPSLLSYSFTLTPNKNIWRASETHPPIAHRIDSVIKNIDERLTRMFSSRDDSIRAEAKFIQLHLKNCKYFYETRMKIHQEYKYDLDETSEVIDFSVSTESIDLVESIKDIAFEYVNKFEPTIDIESFDLSPFSRQCMERIADVIPIGSIPKTRDKVDIEETFSRIEATYNGETMKLEERERTRMQLYKKLKDDIRDVPVSLKTIINVGWFFHLNSKKGKAFQWRHYMNGAVNKLYSLDEALLMYHHWLRQQDELISASIDQSKVHSTLQMSGIGTS